jgi:FtsH-binding integral membrane protein
MHTINKNSTGKSKIISPKNKIDMKKSYGILLACLFAIIITMSSCEVMGDLVQFGVWIGVIIVIAIIAIIYWISRKFKK